MFPSEVVIAAINRALEFGGIFAPGRTGLTGVWRGDHILGRFAERLIERLSLGLQHQAVAHCPGIPLESWVTLTVWIGTIVSWKQASWSDVIASWC